MDRKKLDIGALLIIVVVFIISSCHKMDLESEEWLIDKGQRSGFEQRDVYSLIPNDVPLQGFYKDVFMDAGAFLTNRTSLAAADYLFFSLEYVCVSNNNDTLWQNTMIAGDENDLNGRLLYPDGQPRYRMLFVCGGDSKKHGKSLRPSCLERMRFFVSHGGSYVGTCAGGFFASSGYDAVSNYPYYLHLWPGTLNHTGLAQVYTGIFVDAGSSLLNYYDFGGDNYVAHVRHNKGGYPANWPSGTELLARFDYPEKPSVHGQPVAWSFKQDQYQGRVIMEGSHPEEVSSGERRDFTAAMLRYATDGVGCTTIKGELENGEEWVMDKGTADNDPDHTMIGDLQYHHFVVDIPNGTSNVTFELSSDAKCDLQLTICRDTYAYEDVANYVANVSGPNQRLSFVNLPGGLWYVAVRCLTTVNAIDTPLGQEYSGRIDVLNGMPYRIKVSWEKPQTAIFQNYR